MNATPDQEPLAANVVEIPLTKERLVFVTPDDGADAAAFDFFLGPGGGVPDVHQHGLQAEHFRCVRGELTVLLDDGPRVLRPGDEVELPPGTFHALSNDGDTEVECRVAYRPAGRSEKWLKLVGAAVRRTGRDPGLLDIAPSINDVNFYIKGPPIWAQRALFAVLGPIATLLGRRRRMLAIASETYGAPFEW